VAVVRRQILDEATAAQDLQVLEHAVTVKLGAAPGDPALLSLLADAQRRLKDGEGLAVTLEKLAALQPSHALDWERLMLAVHRDRWTEAKSLLEKIAAAGDDAAFLAPLRLTVLAHLGDVDAVLAAAGEPKTKEDRAQLVGALQHVGWDLWDAGRDAEAEAVFRKAASLVPENAPVGQIVAQLFSTAEERTARAQKVEASWSAVDSPAALLQEGSTRLVAGDAAGAYPLLVRASALLPEEPSAWYNLGLAAKKTERFDEAVAALQHALSLRADWAPALRALADAQAKTGACQAAVATARRAAEVDPASAEPYVTLVNCLQTMGDQAGAARPGGSTRRGRRAPASSEVLHVVAEGALEIGGRALVGGPEGGLGLEALGDVEKEDGEDVVLPVRAPVAEEVHEKPGLRVVEPAALPVELLWPRAHERGQRDGGALADGGLHLREGERLVRLHEGAPFQDGHHPRRLPAAPAGPSPPTSSPRTRPAPRPATAAAPRRGDPCAGP
jgi:tetratricopeptide (TPR) repeat protein